MTPVPDEHRVLSFPPPRDPVTTYRVGWAPYAYHAVRMPRVLLNPVIRRDLSHPWLRWLAHDMGKELRRAASLISRDGLVPPWQAEIQVPGCDCNAVRGWTRRQAIVRVVAEHNRRARVRRCGDNGLTLKVINGAVEVSRG